jgi:hypothetical protein
MAWSYDAKTRTTDGRQGLILRAQIEEAADLLHAAGIKNRLLVVDVLKALSGLGKGEVRFNVDLGSSFRKFQRKVLADGNDYRIEGRQVLLVLQSGRGCAGQVQRRLAGSLLLERLQGRGEGPRQWRGGEWC